MAAAMYQLTMRSGPTPGKSYPLEQEEIFLGRDLANDVPISDPEVSRRHARFIMQADGIVIEDLGSTNGTFINGQRISTPQILHAGDVITFGENIVMVFEKASYDPDATVVASQGAPAPAPQPSYQRPAAPERSSYQAPAQPAYQQPKPTPQNYANRVPETPYESEQPKKRGLPVWLIILIVGIVVLLCVIAVTLYFMPESWWCTITFGLLEGCP
jgi:pSer/pThr/pTyr-binding forkhead associated (FHA) protein